MSSEFNHDLTPVEEQHTIGGVEYKLREIDGASAIRWRNAESACYSYAPDGSIAKIVGMAETVPLLVSLCLVNGDGKTPVTLDKVKSWPDRIQQTLYRRAKEISGLDRAVSLEDLLKQKQAIEDRIAVKQAEEAERKKLLSTISAG